MCVCDCACVCWRMLTFFFSGNKYLYTHYVFIFISLIVQSRYYSFVILSLDIYIFMVLSTRKRFISVVISFASFFKRAIRPYFFRNVY